MGYDIYTEKYFKLLILRYFLLILSKNSSVNITVNELEPDRFKLKFNLQAKSNITNSNAT